MINSTTLRDLRRKMSSLTSSMDHLHDDEILYWAWPQKWENSGCRFEEQDFVTMSIVDRQTVVIIDPIREHAVVAHDNRFAYSLDLRIPYIEFAVMQSIMDQHLPGQMDLEAWKSNAIHEHETYKGLWDDEGEFTGGL